jgi:hypothetical protein
VYAVTAIVALAAFCIVKAGQSREKKKGLSEILG